MLYILVIIAYYIYLLFDNIITYNIFTDMHTMYSINKAFYLKDSPLKKDTRDMMCMKF